MALQTLLRTADLTPGDLATVLDLSEASRRDPQRRRDLLQGEMVVVYFAKPSTRTRLSMTAAVARLGGCPSVVGPQDLQLGRGETIPDTAKVISRYAKAFVIRTYKDSDVAEFGAAATIPVVNALTDGHHPCQSLADLLTLRQRFGDLRKVVLTYVGDGNNVAHSLLEGMALAGGTVRVATPEGYTCDPEVVARSRAIADRTGAVVEVGHDPQQAARGAHALYADTWMSMNTPEEERHERERLFAPYRIDDALMALAHPEGVFLHCLPAHRGDEVTAEVMDGPRSAIWDQAENRLHTAAGVLEALIERRLQGA